jgi:hypothetical protein
VAGATLPRFAAAFRGRLGSVSNRCVTHACTSSTSIEARSGSAAPFRLIMNVTAFWSRFSFFASS